MIAANVTNFTTTLFEPSFCKLAEWHLALIVFLNADSAASAVGGNVGTDLKKKRMGLVEHCCFRGCNILDLESYCLWVASADAHS